VDWSIIVDVLQMESSARPLFMSKSIYELDVGTYDNVLTVRTYDTALSRFSVLRSTTRVQSTDARALWDRRNIHHQRVTCREYSFSETVQKCVKICSIVDSVER